MDTHSIHQAMLDPATYPEPVGPIEFRETHISRLYLTPHHVYKIKKPVDFGFLDFTTLEQRQHFCQEEVRLNQRFAPDTYLGVVPIRSTAAGIRLGGRGIVVEYAVQMRRLSAQQMLDRRLAETDPSLPAEMERLGRRLAALHEESPVCRENGGKSDLETVYLNWQENFRQASPFLGHTLSARALALLTDYVHRFLDAHADLLTARERSGFVREGHGDLHAEHVCLTEPIRIYDCIEFNRRFRVADTAADFAFLLMDLEFRRRRDLARRLREAYGRAWEDPDLDRLLPFYKIYRAFVRGKVESFLAADHEAETTTRNEAAALAMHYFNLALAYLCPKVIVLIGGLMGSGKSTLGTALADALGAHLLRSDSLRKELAGDRAASGSNAPFGQGIYAAEFTRRTYDLLLIRSRELLSAGDDPVVVDASFLRREERDQFRQAGMQAAIPVIFVLTECDRQTALIRLDARQAAGKDLSDGRRELFDLQLAAFEPFSQQENAFVIDTHHSIAYNVQSLLCEIISRIGMRR